MNHRTSDEERLSTFGLPFLQTPAELAAALGLSVTKLRWLCFHTEAATRVHYVQFEVPKKSGGTRTLSAPHQTLAAAQQWVMEHILMKLPVEPPAHGFVPGRSTLTNAKPHAGKDIVVNVDLKSFFPSVGFARVRHLFSRAGYSGAVATLLALLCTECPRRKVMYEGTTYFVATGPRGLPQGACTSPAASNQVARRLDRRLGGLARKMGLEYTRYADDLTFSAGPGFGGRVGYLLARVRHVASDEGFSLNPKKTRVQRPNARQAGNGVGGERGPGRAAGRGETAEGDPTPGEDGGVGGPEPGRPPELPRVGGRNDRLRLDGSTGGRCQTPGPRTTNCPAGEPASPARGQNSHGLGQRPRKGRHGRVGNAGQSPPKVLGSRRSGGRGT